PAEAEQQHRHALALREKLAADSPAVPQYQVELGGSCCNLGNLVRNSGRPDESLLWYEKAIRALTGAYEQDRLPAQARQFLRNSHLGRARASENLRQYAAAVKDLDRAVALNPSKEQPAYRAARALARVNAGQVAEAVAEVAELTKSSN